MTIIRKMKKSEFLIGLFSLMALFALAFVSCDDGGFLAVGLGESIDTSAPTVSITAPASSQVVSGAFSVEGTCYDDKSVGVVSVTIKNTVTGQTVGSYNAGITGTSWSAGVAQLPDGTYSAEAICYDAAGRQSGVATRVFEIDNTPPVFCLAKPNSLNITDPAAYGRDVTIKGEIADDHAVKQMDIRVFKYDSAAQEATEITSRLAKTSFSGFETAGGTEVTIAKFFPDNEISSISSDDMPLYQNYKAMYTDLGASVGDTVRLYVFPYLTDAAGNKSDRAYIQTSLKQLASKACNVDTTSDSLQTAQFKKILNGSYSLNELDLDTIKQILNGQYDQSAIGTNYLYYAQLPADAASIGDNVPLAMSLNANNSPMYEFGGYSMDKDNLVFAEVTNNGTMSVKVSAGLDGNEIIANTVRVYLWECDDTLKLKDGLDLNDVSTASYSSDNTDPAKAFSVTDSDGNKVQDLADTVKVSTATYKITLPGSLSAGVHYLLTAGGVDIAQNKFYSSGTYAFMVATSGDAPKVEVADQFFVNARAIAASDSTNPYKAQIKISDKTEDPDGLPGNKDGTLQKPGNGVSVRLYLYKGYAKTKGYLSDSDLLQTLDEVVFKETQIIKDSAGEYHVDLPVNKFNLTGADNYTVAVEVQAKNTGATSERTTYIFWADATGPVIDSTPPARKSKDGKYYICKETDGKEIVDITAAGATTKSYAFTPRGKWSDLSGSGTSEIFYALTPVGAAVPTVTPTWTKAADSAVAEKGVNYYTKQGGQDGTAGFYIADTTIAEGDSVKGKYTLSLGGSWMPISGAPKSVGSVNWNAQIPVSNSSGNTLSLVAVDQTGNISAVSTISNIMFDFADPKINIPAITPYYKDGSMTLAVSVDESSDMAELNVTAKKNGLTSSLGGLTIKRPDPDDKKSVSLEFNGGTNNASDGKWSFEITATDKAERSSSASFEFTIDTVAPAVVNHYTDSSIDRSKDRAITIGSSGSINDWHNTENLTIKGKYKELTSGLDKVTYILTPAGGSALEEQSEAIGGTTGDEIAYSISPVGFKEGSNYISIKALDLAGNDSASATYTIKVDATAPLVSSAWYTYGGSKFTEAAGTAMANGSMDMTVYGTLEEPLSGIKSLDLRINSASVIKSVLYTTAENLNQGTTPAEKQATWTSASWQAYADILDKTKITGYVAVVDKDKLSALSSGDAELCAVAADLAGNETNQRKFLIQFDNTPPEIKVLSPEYGASVNGSVGFKGTADDNSLSSVKAYWSLNSDAEIDSSRAINPDHEIAINGNYSWYLSLAATTVDNDAKTITLLDGTQYAGTPTNFFLKILATDKAENQKVTVHKFVADPQGDRPKITLTTAALSEMGESNYVWYDSQKLEGAIEDDDGIQEFKYRYSTDAGTTWTAWSDISVSGGAWEAPVPADSKYKIEFYVKDTVGTVFNSVKSAGKEIYLSPVIAGKDVSIKTGDTSLYLKVDTNRPEYENLVYKTSAAAEGPYDWADADDHTKLGTVGGQKKFIQLEFDAKDANGVTAAALTLNGVKYDATVGAYDSTKKSYPCVITAIDVSALDSEVYTPSLAITGSFGDDKSNDVLSFPVDNTEPVVNTLAPDANAHYGNITVYGTVDYAKQMQYALTYTDLTHDGTQEPAANEYKDIIGAAMTWFVYFDGDKLDSTTQSHAETFARYIISHAVKQTKTYTTTTESGTVIYKIDGVKVEVSDANGIKLLDGTTAELTATDYTVNKKRVFDKIVPIYIWIKAVDDVGNVYNEPHLIKYDPQGGRPTLTFGSPDKDEARVGGRNIKLIGGANDDEEVKAVFLQIISTSHPLNGSTTPKYEGGTTWGKKEYDAGKVTKFEPSKNDLDYLVAAGYKVYKMRDYPTITEWSGSGTPADYGVLADFKGSAWSLKINENGEFNPSSGTNELVICGYAYDGSKLSLPMYRQVLVDADSPIISNQYLKQYSGDAVTASREYTDKMYVKDAWNLVFDLSDGDDVAKIYVGMADSADDAKSASLAKKAADTSDKDVKKHDVPSGGSVTGSSGNYTVKIPLETGSGVGSKFVYVWFADNKGNYGDYAFAINYDNVAPVIASTSIDSEVCNSNGHYSVGAKVTEASVDSKNQSGFDKFVIYFKRGNKIYDPMISKKKSGAPNPDNWATVSEDPSADGLYWFDQAIETRDTANLNVITLTEDNAHIHAGRLVKMGGVVYTILSKNGKTLTLSGQVESSFTTAQFAYANVIDNTKSENGTGAAITTEGYGYGYPSAITNDDGDLMVEEAKIQGTACNLTAQINSRNIPDGKIDICYVAFDKAGNVALVEDTTTHKKKPYTVSAMVSNNAPRLSAVTVASDFNYNGIYTDAGESRVYNPGARVSSATATAWDKAWPELTLGSEDLPFIAAKGAVKVTPELLGGNGALTWTCKYAGSSSASTAAALSDDTTEENVERTVSDILLPAETLKAATVGKGLYEINVLDSTEGGAQKALINLYMKNDVNDGETPVAKTKRFYWKSLTNNSVYGSSSAQSQADLQGHIELEETFTNDAGASVTYSTPKVSGKIVIKGTAFDNAGIKSISLTIPGITVTNPVAACDFTKAIESRWTQTSGSLDTNGYHFVLDTDSSGNIKERYTNTGHFVSWTLEVDTEKYNGGTTPAATDVNFVLSIKDKNNKDSSATTNRAMTVYGTTAQAAAGKYYAEERFAAADASDKFENADYSADEFTAFVPANIAEASGTAGVNKYAVTPVNANYTMDIVPYITKVTTTLSELDSTNGVTDRSSLGAYPIYVYKNSTDTATDVSAKTPDKTETVTIHGFNLNGAKYGSTALGNSTNSSGTLTSGSITGGAFALTVNGVSTLNNSNNNNAKGSYSSTATIAPGGTYSVYKNYVNRQPNNNNNNNLTDDVVFDVWQLNNKAAAPISGNVEDPQMKINPVGGKIGFAFGNGLNAFSMPNSTYSWSYWAWDYQGARYTALNYDPAGYVWAAAAGQDTNSGGSDSFFIETNHWREHGGFTGTNRDSHVDGHNYYHDMTKLAWCKIERLCVDSTVMPNRIQSPSIATTNKGVYMAYYDDRKATIRYKAGDASAGYTINKDGSSDHTSGVWASPDLSQPSYAEFNSGFFKDEARESNMPYSEDNVQIVVGNGGSGYTDSGRGNAAPYVSIAAINGGDTRANDVVVMVWNDGSAIKYMYTTSDPMKTGSVIRTYTYTVNTNKTFTLNSGEELSSITKNGQAAVAGTDYTLADNGTYKAKANLVFRTTATISGNYLNASWSTPIDAFGGKVSSIGSDTICKVAVDQNNGVHIAAATGSEVWYSYLSSISASPKVARVDSYGATGESLTLDAALDADGNPAPQIGYYSAGSSHPKFARWNAKKGSLATLSNIDGTDDYGDYDDTNDSYTGNWEVANIPTVSEVRVTDTANKVRQNINVGVWKDASGKVKASVTGNSFTKAVNNGIDTTVEENSGDVYGNGSKNAVLGYMYGSISEAYIETAQRVGDYDN